MYVVIVMRTKLLAIVLSLLLILVVFSSGCISGEKKKQPSKTLYCIVWDEQKGLVVFDKTISLREGETFTESFSLESTVQSVMIEMSYNEDRLFSGNDEIDITISPPEEVTTLCQEFSHHHMESANWGKSAGERLFDYYEYSYINATSKENALNYFYDQVDISYGDGEWKLQIEYIGDGSLNLDDGGEISVRFQYVRISNFRAEVFEGHIYDVHEGE